MSIIYDALKKIEDDVHKEVEIKKEKRHKPKRKIYIMYAVYALVISLGLFGANILFGFLARLDNYPAKHLNVHPPAEANIPQTQAGKNKTEITQPLVVSPPQKAVLPPLILNGVFFSGNESYALINNQIVKEGDVIAAATVVRITLEAVTLEANGSRFELPNLASK